MDVSHEDWQREAAKVDAGYEAVRRIESEIAVTTSRAEVAESRLEKVEGILRRISNWLVVFPIASHDDLQQSAAAFVDEIDSFMSGVER